MNLRSVIGPRNSADKRRRIHDLGEMSELQFAQHQQWHDVWLGGPTTSIVGVSGNDLPCAYYYDPSTQTEYVFVADGPIDWSRTHMKRCIVPLRVGGSPIRPHLVVGLFSDVDLTQSVRLISHSRHRALTDKENLDDRDAMPSQWEALNRLVTQSIEFLPWPVPRGQHDWRETADYCLETLLAIGERRPLDGRPLDESEKTMRLFFETFRSNETTYEREGNQPFQSSAELICQAGLAASLLEYAQSNPQRATEAHALGSELAGTLKDFFDEETGVFQNTYPPRGEEWRRRVVDTWYLFNNTYEVLRVARSTRDSELRNLGLRSVDRLIAFVKSCKYMIPLFAKVGLSGALADDGEVIGFALNPSVLGMHSALLVLAAQVVSRGAEGGWNEDGIGLSTDRYEMSVLDYENEAKRALKLLHRWPISQTHHQAVQLAWAIRAADALGEKTLRDDFAKSLLLTCYRQGKHAGLFQGCAGMGYPAFRETVEAIEAFVPWANAAPGDLRLPDLIALAVWNCAQFISVESATRGLPQEGLGTREQPGAANVGLAIYAAPQVFDLARLQMGGRLGQ